MKNDKSVIKIEDVSLDGNVIINAKQFNFLFRATPEHHIYKRPAKGGGEWSYVKGSYVQKVLNFVTGFNWDFEVVKQDLFLEAGQVIVLGKLTLRINGQALTKMQYGRADIKFLTEPVLDDKGNKVYYEWKGKRREKRQRTNVPVDLGNDFKAASTDALKKCGSLFGIAQDVYGPEDFRETQVETDPGFGEEDVAKYEALLDEAKKRVKGINDLVALAADFDKYPALANDQNFVSIYTERQRDIKEEQNG